MRHNFPFGGRGSENCKLVSENQKDLFLDIVPVLCLAAISFGMGGAVLGDYFVHDPTTDRLMFGLAVAFAAIILRKYKFLCDILLLIGVGFIGSAFVPMLIHNFTQ